MTRLFFDFTPAPLTLRPLTTTHEEIPPREGVCDIPTQNPDVFLCRQTPNLDLRWNPWVYRDPSHYLQALQRETLVASRSAPRLEAESQGETGLFEGVFHFLASQLRNMSNGLNPPTSPATFLFGCAPARPRFQNPPITRAPLDASASETSAPDAATQSLPSGMRVLWPGISVADFQREFHPGIPARVTVLRLDLSRVDLSLIEIPRYRFDSLATMPNIDLAVNGGFFEHTHQATDRGTQWGLTASGLAVRNGVEVASARRRGGSGVLVVNQGRARLVPFEAIDDDVRRAEFALQCGPRLIETDGSVGIYRDDGRFNRRTAVCLRDGGRTLDLVIIYGGGSPIDDTLNTVNPDAPRTPRGGPTLFQLANWLHEGLIPGDTGCESALNLDGGPSTALHVRGRPDLDRIVHGPLPWAVGVRSRR